MSKHLAIADHIKKLVGRDLQEEEGIAVEWWVKGRALDSIRQSQGFEVVLEFLEAYADADERKLLSLPVGDPAVPAAHAAAATSRSNLARFKEDVAAAVEAAKDAPDAVKEAYRGMPPESV